MTFGVIIHYGLYSFYGYDDVKSAKRRSVQNGSEWYYGRLIDTNQFRPISGHKYTKEYHATNFPSVDYFDNINKVIEDPEKVKQWVTSIKNSGAKYIILTARHHDGLCLWNTSTSGRKSKMDVCQVFADECQKQGMEYGFYYSWFQFDQSFTVKYFRNVCLPQIKELIGYKPNHLWFDGQWKIKQKGVLQEIGKLTVELREKKILYNDRIGGDDFSSCSYRVFADRYLPEQKLEVRWQHVNTIGYSWGYNRMQGKEDYKSGEQIVTMHNKVAGLGGELLLNIGPDDKGNIVSEELEVLKYLEGKC